MYIHICIYKRRIAFAPRRFFHVGSGLTLPLLVQAQRYPECEQGRPVETRDVVDALCTGAALDAALQALRRRCLMTSDSRERKRSRSESA